MKHTGLLLAIVLSLMASTAYGQAFSSSYWNFTGWNQNQILTNQGQTFDVFGDESLWVNVTGTVSNANIVSSGSATGFAVGTPGGDMDNITLNFTLDSLQNVSLLSGDSNRYEYIKLSGASFTQGDVITGFSPYSVIGNPANQIWTGVNGPYARQWFDSVDPTDTFSYTYYGPIVQSQSITSQPALLDLGGGLVPEPATGFLALTTGCVFLMQRRRRA